MFVSMLEYHDLEQQKTSYGKLSNTKEGSAKTLVLTVHELQFAEARKFTRLRSLFCDRLHQ